MAVKSQSVRRNAAFDIVIIGGGAAGAAIGYGLAQRGAKVAILDEGDDALRATRGNFGLVWVQTKGAGFPPYARLSRQSAELWGDFARELREETGVDCAYERRGGVHICETEAEFDFFAGLSRKLQEALGADQYEFDVLGNNQLKEIFPNISEKVLAGLYTAYDGVCNPLNLHRALLTGFHAHGGVYLHSHRVLGVERLGDGFRLSTAGDHETVTCERVVLAAGLGNAKLAPMVGLNAPVSPLQGQVIVTERVQPFAHLPNNIFRSTAEGSLLIGSSEADVGYDTSLILPAAGRMAERCARVFPSLANLQVVRIWAALRVMSPDVYPIYEQSASCPGAFVATCHSGITLAAFHAKVLSGWVMSGAIPAEYKMFNSERFDVQKNH